MSRRVWRPSSMMMIGVKERRALLRHPKFSPSPPPSRLAPLSPRRPGAGEVDEGRRRTRRVGGRSRPADEGHQLGARQSQEAGAEGGAGGSR
eukprot:5228323-Pyramimonas_sp.AAC.1